MIPRLFPINNFDDPFLLTVYASTRAEELAITPWGDDQKRAFLQMQLRAQHRHYLSLYPNASYDTINLAEQPIGRLYVERQPDKIKILDITVLPEYRNRGAGAKLIADILLEGERAKKPVQIYIESINPSANLFARLGFQTIAEEGINCLWQWKPVAAIAVTDVKTRQTAAA